MIGSPSPKTRTILRKLGNVLFLVLSVALYLAYYQGILMLFGTYINNLVAVLVLCVSYTFRLDALAAVIAYFAIWQLWHLPSWLAMMLCALFMMTSVLLNHGAMTRLRDFFGRINRPEVPIDALAAQTTNKQAKKNT